MPLSMLRAGETGCIKKINCKDETKHHLENLGFVVGEQVTAISELAGNLIINVKGSRVALNKKLANSILI